MADSLVLSAVKLAIGYDRQVLVRDLDFQLPPGQSLALVGGNGSGKTTLLRTIAGLLPPVAGTLTVLGTPAAAAVRRLAWLGQFQNTNPLLPLRGRDVVRMALYVPRGLWGRITPADEAQVDAAIEAFGAQDFCQRPVSELSGGQRQRLYLAYVWARQAKLVLLDEPLSNLDVGGMALFYQALERWKAAGVSVITATHNLEDAAACDFALELEAGVYRFVAGTDVNRSHHH